MYIIAGPNGAGKSTLYEHQIKNDPIMRDGEFVNADLIQREQLNNLSPEAAYEAARIAEVRRRELIAEHRSFITESTFSHPSKLELIDDAKAQGFRDPAKGPNETGTLPTWVRKLYAEDLRQFSTRMQ
jgi:predicted ABC-type ATPase